MVIIGTIPAGVVGLALQTPLRNLFATPYVAASFLIVNGAIMFAGEQLLQRQQGAMQGMTAAVAAAGGARPIAPRPDRDAPLGRYRDITQVSWRDAALVGLAQVGALIPGISRSGITMVAGLAAGLTHEAAARYTFLLATPVIAAAGALEVPLLFQPAGRPVLGDAVIGAVLAGIAAYLSVRYLMRYFEGGRLYPFAYYCVAAGVISLLLLSIH
jgi:undecaprenyl-diphosphatase